MQYNTFRNADCARQYGREENKHASSLDEARQYAKKISFLHSKQKLAVFLIKRESNKKKVLSAADKNFSGQ